MESEQEMELEQKTDALKYLALSAAKSAYKQIRHCESVLLDLATPGELVEYCTKIRQGRWPEAEPMILKNDHGTMYYIVHVIKDRWPEAEPMILESWGFIIAYVEEIIKGRWEEGEKAIKALNDAKILKRYIEATEKWQKQK